MRHLQHGFFLANAYIGYKKLLRLCYRVKICERFTNSFLGLYIFRLSCNEIVYTLQHTGAVKINFGSLAEHHLGINS